MALPKPADDVTCLITGASSGIGEEIARALAARGLGVTLVARREDRLADLAEELSSEHRIRAETVGADVSDPEARDKLANEVAELGLKVEVLVNNAGYGSGGKFHELDPASEAAMVRTNCEAIVGLTGTYLPAMVERGRGAILNLGSLISFQPVPFQSTYAATKHFVLAFTESVHEELRGTGVTMTAVCPGPVKTEFGEQGGFGGADDKIPDFAWLTPDKVAADAIAGLEAGDRVVVPGLINKVAGLAGHYTPRAVVLPLARRIWPVS